MSTPDHRAPANKPIFSDGIETPQEAHRAIVWDRHTCWLCGDKPVVIEARVFQPASILARIDPIGFRMGRYKAATFFDIAKTGEMYFLYAVHHACRHCRKATQVTCAHRYGDNAHVEFHEGHIMVGEGFSG